MYPVTKLATWEVSSRIRYIAHICIMNCLSTWHFRTSIKGIDDLGGQHGEHSASGKMQGCLLVSCHPCYIVVVYIHWTGMVEWNDGKE